MRRAALALALALLACRSEPLPAPGMPEGLPDPATLNDPELQRREPFRIFDNLHYVGIGWVSAYVLTTSEGLILIDSLYGPFVGHLERSIELLGLDPGDVRYVLVTHAHFDHVGGARHFQQRYGARVGMTRADWALAASPPARGFTAFEPPERDLVLADGDTVTLGDTTVRLYVTPGHTPGVLSLDFTVSDGGVAHRAFTFGGVGLNFSGVERTRQYIASVRRLQALDGIEVNVPNHPFMTGVFERWLRLQVRREGDPHPFVDPQGFGAWLDELLANAELKLATERARAE